MSINLKKTFVICSILNLAACTETLTSNPDAGLKGKATGGKPILVGLDTTKPVIFPLSVQAAYNDDTVFFQMSWQGDRGDAHDYLHYTNGQWQREGSHRREAQSTINNDSLRGKTNVTSTSWESRVTFFLDDPTGPNHVDGFEKLGCFLVCHNDSRFMPEWDASSDLTMYLPDAKPGKLDLWHHRLARANPIGWSDDQYVTTRTPGKENEGGRHGDSGTSPYKTNDIVNNEPSFVLDYNDTTNRAFAFDFNDTFNSPYRFFMEPGTRNALFQTPPNVVKAMDTSTAKSVGYVPREGDTVPRRILRTPTGSRGDISAINTSFTATSADGLQGVIRSNIQRALNTGNLDDTALQAGKVYNIAFAVNTGKISIRDHYVSFPMTISLGATQAADIQAVYFSGNGKTNPPNFSNTNMFPVAQIDTFLPGITSYEFLTGQNITKSYIDPQTSLAVTQSHGGANGLSEGLGCRDCHTTRINETFSPTQQGGFSAGSMEALTRKRGGVHSPTPK